MIAVSSFRAFAKSAEIAANQLAAKKTWESVFDHIIYFAPCVQPELLSSKTRFILTEDFPQIQRMVAECGKQTDWSCIINADIQVGPRLLEVERGLKERHAQSAISCRYQLPEKNLADMGLDWFAAAPDLWNLIAKRVPQSFRIGHILWDTWMLAAFMKIGNPMRCYDVTGSKFIFHPQHEERFRPYPAIQPTDGLINGMKWPKQRLNQYVQG